MLYVEGGLALCAYHYNKVPRGLPTMLIAVCLSTQLISDYTARVTCQVSRMLTTIYNVPVPLHLLTLHTVHSCIVCLSGWLEDHVSVCCHCMSPPLNTLTTVLSNK